MTEPARDRILDAAEACLGRDGIRRTTVARVADEAGLSRAYVYRFFADKATLLSAALIRRDEQFWDEARARVAGVLPEGIGAMVAEAVLLARASPLGPLALSLAESEPEAYAEVIGTYAHEIVPGLSGFWVELVGLAAEGGVIRDDLDIEAAAEWVLRVVVSLVAVPGDRVDTADRASLRTFLATFLDPAFSPV
ncbi:MAG: TetR/AcrR family transcriptional regulator [Nocardioides sp.]